MPHTPGEWEVDETVATGAYGVWRGSDQICSVLTESFLVTDGPENRAERDANARLIAAAPDLLEALRGVVRVADRATDEFDAARAAIAKATK